jgi:hypothetical protein
MDRREPQPKLYLHAIFNYILKLLCLGSQWKELLIEKSKVAGPRVCLGEDSEESFHGNSAP